MAAALSRRHVNVFACLSQMNIRVHLRWGVHVLREQFNLDKVCRRATPLYTSIVAVN